MRDARPTADWHLAWALALGLAAVAWPGEHLRLRAAFVALAAPGLIAQLLRIRAGPVSKAGLAAAWALAAALALGLTGGVTGPLAPVAIMPAAALASFPDRRLLAVGTVLSLVVIAALSLAMGLGVLAAPWTSGPSPWLTLASLVAVAVGLCASLELAGARNREREHASAATAERLRRMLAYAPARYVHVDAGGVITAAFGGQAGSPGRPGERFEAIADSRQAGALLAALELARRSNAASVGAAPPHAPDRFLAIDLRGLGDGEVVAVVRDASQERAQEAWLEQRRVEAEEEAHARARFLANMSHELRTPLNAIIGFSDIMRSRMFGPLAARYAEYAGLIHELGGHLLDLINDVLDMSKIEADRFSLNREHFDAREAVAAAMRLTRVQADSVGIDLRGALPAEPIEVDADRRALKQIVLNLVSNALKFTPPGGQVSVVARALASDLELIVADTGVGIAAADLERLGRPYEQAGGTEQRARGAGLGLSLVRAFAELHGGTMSIRSALGEGTVVTVLLPVLEAPDARRTAVEPPAAPGPSARSAAMGDNVIAFNPHR